MAAPPLKFPLWKEKSVDLWNVTDQAGLYVCNDLTEVEADYIITAVNQHTDLVRQVREHAHCDRPHEYQKALLAVETKRDDLVRERDDAMNANVALEGEYAKLLRERDGLLVTVKASENLRQASNERNAKTVTAHMRLQRLVQALKVSHDYDMDDLRRHVEELRSALDTIESMRTIDSVAICDVALAALRASEPEK